MDTYTSPFSSPAVRMLETRLTPHSKRGPTLRQASDAAAVLMQLIGQADREHFVALYLDARHAITHAHIVSRGTLRDTTVHPREVFKGAVLANSAAIIIGHNHPSGDETPSTADRAITDRLRKAGELLGIELLDSLIVGSSGRYYAISEERSGTLTKNSEVVAHCAEREVTHGS